MGRFVKVFKCNSCGREYAEKHYKNISNNLPPVPIDNKCTYILFFNERNNSSEVSICGRELLLSGSKLMPNFREYFQVDECLEYLKKRVLSELVC